VLVMRNDRVITNEDVRKALAEEFP
jgi:hypothetical protein